jgi:hypothetical protein
MELERTADRMLAILSTNSKEANFSEFPILQKTGCGIQMQK